MKKTLLIIGFVVMGVLANAQTKPRLTGQVVSTSYTVGTLPTSTANTLAIVSDGLTAVDCTVGGGTNRNLCYYNGVSWSIVGGWTRTIFSGTAVLGTSAIASGAKATLVTVAATGVLTTDVVKCGFNGDPSGVVGYAPSSSGTLSILAYPTSGNINIWVYNTTASSITPGAITLNCRVER
jgi:hypothetical protein